MLHVTLSNATPDPHPILLHQMQIHNTIPKLRVTLISLKYTKIPTSDLCLSLG